MSFVRDLHFILYPILALLAWLVARHQREHRPLALFVSWMVAADWVRVVLNGVRADEPRPLVGIARVAYHLDQLVVLSWSFAFMAVALRYFTKRPPAFALVGLAVTWLITLNYPLVSGEFLLWILRLAGICATVVAWTCILAAIFRRRDLQPTLAHLVVILYSVTDFVLYLVPWMGDVGRTWPIVNLISVVQLTVFCAAHGFWLAWRRRLASA
ncbi:MAG: hypothetical protein HYY06_33260 [Deltaproteobacteria bacterium]|nr:hypothetical protein [Deltaproteobacteria bacterium]